MQFDFTASGATTLYFRASGLSDQLGSSLDQVSITSAVPEPQSYALMLGGIAAIGFMPAVASGRPEWQPRLARGHAKRERK